MFCQKCGTKLDDNAKFCGQCGNKVLRESNIKSSTNLDSIVKSGENLVKSVDWKGLKDKAGGVVKTGLNGLADSTVSDVKKYLYIAIASAVLVVIFGSMTVDAFNPAKKVKAKVTYASEPFKPNSQDLYLYGWCQNVTVVYKNQEYTGIREIGLYNPSKSSTFETIDTSVHIGDKVTAYIVNGKLMLDADTVDVSAVKVGFSSLLLLASLGSCAWFSMQSFKRRV